MQTTLCFDFGNTRLKCGLFHDRNFVHEYILETGDVSEVEKLVNELQPDRSILSSVVKHSQQVEALLAANTRFHKLNHTSKLPLTTPVGKPETIGADRLAIVAAAVDLFPGKHNLAIALGTCITYNFINAKHEFLGGSISPGMYMRFRSMNEHTALLPLIKPEHDFPLVGYDTKTNILCGVILGMASEIDGIINAYKLKYNDLNVLLTGGDMSFFTPHLLNKVHDDHDLLYKGLYAISEANNF